MDSREAILAAARRVFARKGYDGTSTREVALAAGVNNAMIYYHFKDKQQLYRAVLLHSFSALERIWDSEIFSSDASVRDKISLYVAELIRFHHANDDLRRIIFREFNVCSENCRWIADNMFRSTFNRMTELLNEGMRRHEVRKCDPSLAIPALFGIIGNIFMAHPVTEHLTGKKFLLTVPKLAEFTTDLFFDGLTSPASSGPSEKRKKK